MWYTCFIHRNKYVKWLFVKNIHNIISGIKILPYDINGNNDFGVKVQVAPFKDKYFITLTCTFLLK